MNYKNNKNAYGIAVVKRILLNKLENVYNWTLLHLLASLLLGDGGEVGRDAEGEMALIYPDCCDPIKEELAKIAEHQILQGKI